MHGNVELYNRTPYNPSAQIEENKILTKQIKSLAARMDRLQAKVRKLERKMK